MADFALLEFPKLILRKIWVMEKFMEKFIKFPHSELSTYLLITCSVSVSILDRFVRTKFSRHEAADLANWSLSWSTHHSYWAKSSFNKSGANFPKNSLNTSVMAYKVWLQVVSIHSLWLWSFCKKKKKWSYIHTGWPKSKFEICFGL